MGSGRTLAPRGKLIHKVPDRSCVRLLAGFVLKFVTHGIYLGGELLPLFMEWEHKLGKEKQDQEYQF